jgi:predicted AlkP superfamily pyrophosphatase or phosphodiesterase
MYLPNYKDGSIVNLISSISKVLGDKPRYKPLRTLNPFELSKSKNIVLLVIDGLGYEYLRKYGKDTIFSKYIKDKITSVFPAATASSLTTFVTALAPQQHAVTGWFMNLKELGLVSVILPFTSRSDNLQFSKAKIKLKEIVNQECLFEKINTKSYVVIPKEYVKSDYTTITTKKAKKVYYINLGGCFRQISQIIHSNNHKKLIYAYWPGFDTVCHKYGVKSKQAVTHFKEINKKLTTFLRAIEKTDTIVIITADHGLIDTNKSKIIELKNHPKLLETLTIPLCGESRVAYCYVHPSKVKQFERYVKQYFKDSCDLFKGEDLIKRNYFGLFEPNENLFDRVGDYILIMKDNFIINDLVLGEEKHLCIGNHGGVSKEEMFVPLIVINIHNEK